MLVSKGLLGGVSEIVHISAWHIPGLVALAVVLRPPGLCWGCVGHVMLSSSRTTVLPLHHADGAPVFFTLNFKKEPFPCGCFHALWLAKLSSHNSPSWVPRKA